MVWCLSTYSALGRTCGGRWAEAVASDSVTYPTQTCSRAGALWTHARRLEKGRSIAEALCAHDIIFKLNDTPQFWLKSGLDPKLWW